MLERMHDQRRAGPAHQTFANFELVLFPDVVLVRKCNQIRRGMRDRVQERLNRGGAVAKLVDRHFERRTACKFVNELKRAIARAGVADR